MKSRRSPSGALRADLSGVAVPRRRRFRRATTPASAINVATVLFDTANHGGTTGRAAPVRPAMVGGTGSAIVAANAARRFRRGDRSLVRHLKNHACDTPRARHDTATGIPRSALCVDQRGRAHAVSLPLTTGQPSA